MCQNFNKFLYEMLNHGGNILELAQYYEHSGSKKIDKLSFDHKVFKNKKKNIANNKIEVDS